MENKTIIGYKFITDRMESKNGKQKWKLGKWYKHTGNLKLCEQGFHACETPLESLNYIYGDRWFIVEARGEMLKDDEDRDKFVASEMRLVKKIDVKAVSMRFACIVARSCLKNFEVKYPKDNRVRKAIEAAEAYIKNPTEANRSAAQSAAESAQSAAESAGSAARSAQSAAESAAVGVVGGVVGAVGGVGVVGGVVGAGGGVGEVGGGETSQQRIRKVDKEASIKGITR